MQKAYKKVYVGLSGGVDSGTSAALLKEQGYDVTGVFIKIWQPEFIECTWQKDRLDAMRVSAALGIPFVEIDLSDEYKHDVVDAMIDDYQKGITPNPDVLCNEKIKFGVFMKWALANGADLLATGHYAQVFHSDNNSSLLRGIDTAKDQSYFLYRIHKDDLSRVLFPIGGMYKNDVRKAASRFGLSVAYKRDSQGLCFVGDVSMSEFLKRYITLESGSVLDTKGNVIGKHEGAPLYTIGQRHGFTIKNNPSIGAQYIISIDISKNILTVSPIRVDAARTQVRLRDMHWIDQVTQFPFTASVQTRYHETPITAVLSIEEGTITSTFNIPHIASPGQSLVIYDGNVCLGGGIICV
jgi:tRNA-specific 2-thiouridylase